MSNIPADRRYTRSHAWARLESDGSVTVGLSDHGQTDLGSLVNVAFPHTGVTYAEGVEAATLQAVLKNMALYSPIDGEVIATNSDVLDRSPEWINTDPYGTWVFKLRPTDRSQYNYLLDAEGYRAAIGG